MQYSTYRIISGAHSQSFTENESKWTSVQPDSPVRHQKEMAPSGTRLFHASEECFPNMTINDSATADTVHADISNQD